MKQNIQGTYVQQMRCASCGFEKQREPENFQYRFVNVDGLNTLQEGLADMVNGINSRDIDVTSVPAEARFQT